MKKIILLACLLLGSTLLFSQVINLQQQDLRQVQVDQISDDDIIAYYKKLQQSGVSLDQALQVAAARGLPQVETTKLQQRIQALMSSQRLTQGGNNKTNNDSVTGDRVQVTPSTLTEDVQFDKRIFGAELFSTSSLTFEPNLRIATPANYVLGTDDQLMIEVFGLSEAKYNLNVSPEGSIYIPNAGPISVAGLTIEDATEKIKAKLASTIYKAIATGETRLQVTLGNIKSIHISIIGQAKKPGGYTVSSLTPLFNALYLCGGPNKTGSYRNIELLRNNKVYKTIDLYKVLVNGNMEDNVVLRDQDIIHIPYYQTRAVLAGEVKRPGIFETVPGENLQTLLDNSGGFTDSAYRSSVKITQLTDREKRIEDVESKDFASYIPKRGDSINVGKVINRYLNRVAIEGAVMRPGLFELTQGLTLKQLIQKADGLREDAFLNRGIITRLKDDLSVEVVPFEVAGVLNNNQPDIPLKREDKVTISSIFDLKNKMTLQVQGEVRFPGTYDFKDSTSIKDVIMQAGGFTEAATGKRIEVARRVTNADVNSTSTEVAQIVQVDAEKNLQFTAGNFYLQPYDVVIVRNNPGYFTQKTVTIQGEVMYPGPYVISSSDEKLSSIVNRAGGLKITADPLAASLRRLNKIDILTELKTQKVSKLINTYKDSTAADSLSKEAVRPYDLIGINLQEVITHPGITNDLILEDGDVLVVPKKNQAVKVRGEVLFPTQFAFIQGLNLKYYVDRAGGFATLAQRRKAFVLGANGNARRVKHFLFFKSYPEIYAGDEIFVPRRPEQHGLNTAETIGITSSVVGMASVIIALLNNLKL